MLIYQDQIHLSVRIMSTDDDESMGDGLNEDKWERPKDRAQLTDYHSDELETAPVSQLQLIHFR